MMTARHTIDGDYFNHNHEAKFKMHLLNPNNFPVESLPPLIKSAVLEMHGNAQFPLPLIVSSAFGAVSLTCQNAIDVRLPIGSVSPCSVFMLLIAESGEGKTPTDHYFTKSIRDFEDREDAKSDYASAKNGAKRRAWTIELAEIESAIQKNRKKCLSADNPIQVDQFNLDYENLQNKLFDHLAKEPKVQRKYKQIFNNVTPAKIALDLHENWPSACLISDEAGSLFKGEAMKDLGLLNQLWDGASLSIDRVSSPSFKVKNARLTISLMAQGPILQNYLNGRGRGARDIGFLARCLIAFPYSTKGSRIIYQQSQSWNALTAFQNRVTEILEQDKLDVDQGRPARHTLEFSEEAKGRWINFRNDVERDLIPGRYLSDVSDFASKMATNLARIAALFHFFEGHQGNISAETINYAIDICNWYIDEFKRLFTKNPEVPIWVSDAIALEESLKRWCQYHPGSTAILKSAIAQYGPAQLRKDTNRREAAIYELGLQNKIEVQKYGKKLWIALNPAHFPVPTYAHGPHQRFQHIPQR